MLLMAETDMQSDAELVRVALRGDRQAYGELFRRHERSVLAVALAVLGDCHRAQDVAQDAFVMAYCRLAELRLRSSFGPWIRQIARHEAVQAIRQTRRSQNVQLPEPQVGQPSDDGTIDEANRQLLRAVMKLPKHERVVIMLRYFEGHSVKTIGKMTGRPTGTVTMQLSRARARLQRWLKETLP
jgi:RNA polymerase sigma-70 factor (ECF subfamily)